MRRNIYHYYGENVQPVDCEAGYDAHTAAV